MAARPGFRLRRTTQSSAASAPRASRGGSSDTGTHQTGYVGEGVKLCAHRSRSSPSQPAQRIGVSEVVEPGGSGWCGLGTMRS
jgi:hypothetical protein